QRHVGGEAVLRGAGGARRRGRGRPGRRSAAGVPAPAVVRTARGDAWARVGSNWVRVYEWVDVLAPDRALDPGEVGRLVAAIHTVEFIGARPEDPWYTDAVGAEATATSGRTTSAARPPAGSARSTGRTAASRPRGRSSRCSPRVRLE